MAFTKIDRPTTTFTKQGIPDTVYSWQKKTGFKWSDLTTTTWLELKTGLRKIARAITTFTKVNKP